MAQFKDLTPDDLFALWEADKDSRAVMAIRQAYYNGIHSIVNSNELGVDGEPKSELVSNFIKYGVDMFVGSIAGEPYNVTALEVDPVEGEILEPNESPALYREIGTANGFDIADVENARNAFVSGYGIETHEYDANTKAYIITPQDPITFHLVWDSNGSLLGAIHVSEIPAGKFYNGEFMADGAVIMVVYTDDSITTYNMIKGNDGWTIPEGGEIPHAFGAVPIVLWQINNAYNSHISNDIIGQQDEYNETDSRSGDDLRWDSDGVLEVKGYSIDQIKELSATLREWKVFPVPENGGIRFVKKDVDFARTDARISRTRSNLFMGLGVPDVEEIVGSTGDTSGIALQLKFKPMQDASKTIIAFFRAGVRDRIAMINAIMNDAIKDVQVNIEFDLPRNSIEEWQNIANVNGIVSHTKQLEMLSDVEDPDQERKRLDREKEDARFIDRTGGSVEQVVARNDADIRDKAIELAPNIETMIATISDAVLNHTLKATAGTKQTPTDV